MEDRYNIIAHLIAKDLKGELSRSQKKVLDKWIAASEKNKILYNRLTDKKHLLEQLTVYNELSEKRDAEVQKCLDKIDFPTPVKLSHSPNRGWLYAGFAAVLLLSTCAFYYFIYKPSKHKNQSLTYKNPDDKIEILPNRDKAILTLADGSTVVLQNLNDTFSKSQGNFRLSKNKNGLKYEVIDKTQPYNTALYNVIATPRGGWLPIELPDGSKIILNSATSITIPVSPVHFPRWLSIKGEAYFEIAHNKSNEPFRVFALASIQGETSAEVEVKGTRFIVSAYPHLQQKKVTLLDGELTVLPLSTTSTLTSPYENRSSLNIKHNSNAGTIKPKPGQQVQINNNGQTTVKDVDLLMTSAWKDGFLYFKNTPTREVIWQLKNLYDLNADHIPEKITDCLHTGRVDANTSLYGIMKAMEKDCPNLRFHYNANAKKIEVSLK